MDSNSTPGNSSPVGARDLAALRNHESALRDLLSLLRAEQLAITSLDLRTNEIHWSDLMYEMFGVDRESFSPTLENLQRILGPRAWSEFGHRLDAARGGRLSQEQYGYNITHADGSVHVLNARALLLYDGNHLPTHMVATYSDATRRDATEDELAKRVKQQAAIATLGVSALRDSELDALFQQATRLVSATSSAEYVGAFELVDGRLRYRAGVGFEERLVADVSVPGDCSTQGGYALHHARPVLVTDVRAESRFRVPDELFHSEVRSGISVPIQAQGGDFGTLCAFSPRVNAFTEDDVHFHQAVANALAAAIEVGRRRDQLSTQSRRLLSAQEDERARIARELHDELGQQLTAMWLSLKAAARAGPEGAIARINETLALVDATINQVRELARSLRPSHLDDLGLEAALRAQVARLQEHVDFPIHLRVEGVPAELSPQIATACFRIVQEALTNAIRHARASSTSVEVIGSGNHLEIEVRDNGIGFDPALVRQRMPLESGLGLLSLEERADLVGGKLTITSGDAGTIVRARLPMSPTAPP